MHEFISITFYYKQNIHYKNNLTISENVDVKFKCKTICKHFVIHLNINFRPEVLFFVLHDCIWQGNLIIYYFVFCCVLKHKTFRSHVYGLKFMKALKEIAYTLLLSTWNIINVYLLPDIKDSIPWNLEFVSYNVLYLFYILK